MIKNLKVKSKKLKVYILIGIALVLGAAIYNQQQTKLSSYPTLSPSPSPTTAPRLLPANLTEEERFILFPPDVDASRSAKDKHAKTVAKLAKIGKTLEINSCQPTPLVLQVKQGTEFTIKNQDNTNHKIMIDEEHIYDLPANGSQSIKAEFKYGTGDYGYVCEGVGLTGFLHVVP